MKGMARWVGVSLAALAAARVAMAIRAAVSNIRGDYYASLPGEYVRTVNPTLWDSPDMAGAWGYHANTYFHGPTQYLTLYPVAYLDSYAAIARVLLPIYAVVVAAAFVLLHSGVRRLVPSRPIAAPLFACVFLFFPLLQALIQREFEVIVYLGLTLAFWCLVTDRRTAAGAVLGYIAWFKYVPLLFLGYLSLRRWYASVGAFVATSAVVLLLSHVLFGLGLFINNNVPNHAAQVFNLWSYDFVHGPGRLIYGTGFCHGWIELETTLANVRHGLCSLSYGAPWVPANVIYMVLCLVIAAAYLAAHVRIERMRATPETERWRRAIEFSIVIVVYSCFFFSHYYYLIVLVLPFSVLLARYLSTFDRLSFAMWATAYVLIAAFVVPTSMLSRISGVDIWAYYIKGAWFLWGELLLVYLLLREYWRIARAGTAYSTAV